MNNDQNNFQQNTDGGAPNGNESQGFYGANPNQGNAGQTFYTTPPNQGNAYQNNSTYQYQYASQNPDPNASFYCPQGVYQPPVPDPKGSSAQTLGIIALIALLFCQIVSIVCGAIAMSRAKASRNLLQYETQAAKTGRICGLIGLILGIVSTVLAIAYVALMVVLALSGFMG